MTTCAYDLLRHRLVLDRTLLLAAGECAVAGSTEPEAMRRLAELGVLAEDGAVAPDVLATARAVGSPLLRAEIRVMDTTGSRLALVWVSADRAVVHTGNAHRAADVISVATGLLPMLVAGAVGLAAMPVTVETVPSRGFAASSGDVRAAVRGLAPPPWQRRSNTARLWSVTWGRAPDGRDHAVTVLDVDGVELWKPAERVGTALRWERTTPALVWRVLAGVALVDAV